MLLRLHFVLTLLHQEFISQLFSPYNILWLKEILENQKNYVTAEVNLAQFQRLMRNFSGPSWSFFRVSNFTFPSYLFGTQHDSIVYHIFGTNSE